jgi:hypothetical protein
LESARLYEETQHRAAEERLIAKATTRIRETLDLERTLSTGADEIFQALGLERVVVRLKGAEDGLESESGGGEPEAPQEEAI